MYNPDHFRIEDRDTVLAFMRRHSFATVVTSGEGGMQASHLPLMVRDAGSDAWPVLLGHMARANPQWQEMESGAEALIIFHGPHGYVSPSLYEVHPSVPTWSYQVVHAYGPPEVVHQPDELETLVRDLIAEHETGGEGNWRPEWPEGYIAARLKEVVGFRIPLTRVEAKFKVSQNRPAVDRKHVADAFEASPDPVLRDLGRTTREQLARQGQ